MSQKREKVGQRAAQSHRGDDPLLREGLCVKLGLWVGGLANLPELSGALQILPPPHWQTLRQQSNYSRSPIGQQHDCEQGR